MRFPTLPGSGYLAQAAYDLRKALHIRDQSSHFLSEWEQTRIFRPENRGLVVDGKQKRLTHDASFMHCGVFTKTGGGKSSIYVKPNILMLENVSMLVTDPSGELFRDTAVRKAKQGVQDQSLESR